ncbi:hypothetical protein Pmani_018384 [Petrolisthes manimaculis]|uniref:GrpE protein homolog n=1 Tax=Petrolisthes manimaculis TaxID=1843537 RepID=A0AAE1PKC7_9EUCA|nr:hypothetical protein Pmani_018384 [Petrolisthes manimaculis]
MLTRIFTRHSSILRGTLARGWTYRSGQQMSTTQNAEQNKNPTPDNEVSEADKELNDKIAVLTKENNELLEKVSNIQDKYQRTLADRENVRNRLEKQIIDAKQFGIQGFCKDLLEVSDVFRKAIESVPNDKINESNRDLKNLYEGVAMTETQLLTVFRRHGLEQVVPKEGDKFDPSLQEAMFELPPNDNNAPGTVAHIIRKGWTLHSRCIRSAQVGVVKS